MISDMSAKGSGGQRARVVLITGEPGSGKTTLGVALSRAVRIPFVSRDDVRAGLFFTAGAWSDTPRSVPTSEEAVEAMLRIVETIAGLGVSCVVEYVFRQERPADLVRVVAAADCVVVQTWCAEPLARCADRDAADRLLNRQPVLDALGHETIHDRSAAASARMRSVVSEMQTDFDLPILRVNTGDGYEPSLERVVAFITDNDPAR
jgi:predicted kinase